MWETKDVLLIFGVLSAAVTTVAVVRTQVTALATKVAALEDGSRRQGERIGRVETILTVNAAVAKHMRTPPFGTSIPREIKDDDSGTGGRR